MLNSNYNSEFEKILTRDKFTTSVNSFRKEAFNRLQKTGFPTQKWEDWRFTNLTRIAKGEYRISEIQDGPNGEIEISSLKMDNVNTLVIYNGHYQKKLSSVPSGVQLLSGLDYLKRKKWEIHLK